MNDVVATKEVDGNIEDGEGANVVAGAEQADADEAMVDEAVADNGLLNDSIPTEVEDAALPTIDDIIAVVPEITRSRAGSRAPADNNVAAAAPKVTRSRAGSRAPA